MPANTVIRLWTLVTILIAGIVTACAPGVAGDMATEPTPVRDEEVLTLPDLSGVAAAESEPLRVVVTTSIIGDVVRNVAGDRIDLTVLMPPGQDPHGYQPTASDLATVSRSHLVFVNGWDLEEGLIADLESAAQNGVIVPISAGIVPLEGGEHDDSGADADHVEEGDDHIYDPHVWFDTANVQVWVQNVVTVLSEVDSGAAATYRENGRAFSLRLEDLDQEIRAAVALISEDHRRLVTNHDTFAYFARAYGFEIIGTILPGASTGIEPSAASLTDLIRAVEEAGVKALFIENTVGDGLSDVLVEETGASIYSLYTDALGPPGSGAESYVGMMQKNVETLVEALGE